MSRVKDLVTHTPKSTREQAMVILKWAIVLMFIGRGWQYFYFETSFREIFWNYNAFAWFVEGWCTIDWNAYLSTPRYDGYIEVFEKALGLYFVGVAISLICFKPKKWLQIAVLLAIFFQIPQAYFSFSGFSYNWALLLEFSAQFVSPIIWLLAVKKGWNKSVLSVALSTIALTFICHGLYASGVYNVPQKFYAMCIKTIGITKEQSMYFLIVMGVLDFVAALLVFVPKWKIQKIALLYMVFWGFVTAVARPWANYYSFDAWRSLFQHFPDFLIRAPHFLLPLCILMVLKPINKHVRTDL